MAKRKKRQQTVQKRKQERIQKTIVYGSIVGVLILVAVFVYLVVLDRTAPIPDGVLTAYEGIPQSMTDQGFGVLGDPSAPIEVMEFSSFGCPNCKNLQPEMKSLLPEIENGNVRLTFVPIYNIAPPGADEGARAAVCAGRQGKFYEMHDVMFHWQGSTGFGNRNIKSAAEQLDLDVDAFMDCYGSDEVVDIVRGAEAFFGSEMQRLGVTKATPRITVDGNSSSPSQIYSDVEALIN